jgi:hypothetical protein
MTDADVARMIQAHPHAPEILDKKAREGSREVSARAVN